jgi:hypothetical protein
MSSEKVSKETKVSNYSDKRQDEILGFSINTSLLVDDESRKDFSSLITPKNEEVEHQIENCVSIESKRNSMHIMTNLNLNQSVDSEPSILDTAEKCKSFQHGIKNRKKIKGSVWGIQNEEAEQNM